MTVAQIRQYLEIIGNPSSSSEDLKMASKVLTQQFFKSSDSIPALIEIVSNHENQSIRHLASVEARKIIQKQDGFMWEKLDENTRENIKNSLLQMTISEQSTPVRNSLAHVISVAAKNEIQNGRWNDLIKVLYEACSSPNRVHREVGIYILNSLFEDIADKMESYIPELLGLFSTLVNDGDSLLVGVTTVQALGKVADFIDEQDTRSISTFQNLVPAIVNVLQKCLHVGDHDGVAKVFEVFDDLLLLEVPLLSNHFADLINLFLSICSSQEYDDDIRVRGLSLLMWSVLSAKGKISKSNLIPSILDSMFKIASEEEPESRDEDYPAKLAIQVINTLSTTFPPQQVFPYASTLAINGLRSSVAGERKASMLSIAVLVEGCADFMRKHVNDVLQLVIVGLKDVDFTVRRAACMALGALCDDFEEEMTAEHATILPLLFNLINDQDSAVHSEALSTLDVLIENLEELIIPYMDDLMKRLFHLWENSNIKIQITTTNCIGSVAFSASEKFTPYFEPIVARLTGLMTITNPLEMGLRSVATDCVGAVATAVGKDKFRPYLNSVMSMAVEGLKHDYSQLNQCTYILYGVLAQLYENDFAPYLQIIVPRIIQSCNAAEKEFGFEEEDELDIGEDQDDNKVAFATGIAQEKDSSIDTLGELFSATKGSFMPYVPDSINCALQLLDHYHSSVRVSATGCLLKFFKTAYLMVHPSEWESGLPIKIQLHENVANIGKLAMEGILLLLADEDDRNVVNQCLQLISEALKLIGPAAVCQSFSGENPSCTGSHLDMVSNQLLLILRGEHPCQSVDSSELDLNENEDIAELDALVISSAADTVGALAAAVGPQFESYCNQFLPLISKYYKKSKPLSDRSMAIGAVAEIVEGLEHGVTVFTADLLNLFLKGLVDEEDEVRSNAAFGVGMLCLFSNSDLKPQLTPILEKLHPLLMSTSSTNMKDNACGALCRLILKYHSSIPLDIAVTLVLNSLPLKNDYQENTPVFKALIFLLNSGNAQLLNQMNHLMQLFAMVLEASPSQLDDSTRSSVLSVIRNLKTNHPGDFVQILEKIPEQERNYLTNL